MRRSWLLALVALLLLAPMTKCVAEDDWADTDPWYGQLSARAGFMYDDKAEAFHEFVSFPVLGYRGFTLEAGLGNGEHVFGALTYNLASLEDFDFNLPLAEYVDLNVGVWFGTSFATRGTKLETGDVDRVGFCFTIFNVDLQEGNTKRQREALKLTRNGE